MKEFGVLGPGSVDNTVPANDSASTLDKIELCEKILGVFHLAYAGGWRQVAGNLMDALDGLRVDGDEAAATSALIKARLWMRFVQLRDSFVIARAHRGARALETVAASRAMREAYLCWSTTKLGLKVDAARDRI